MKIARVFLQPLLLAAVWFFNFRPASWFLDSVFPTLQKSLELTPAVKSTIDVALLASIIAFFSGLWKFPLEVETKLVNLSTRREHSTFIGSDLSHAQRMCLEIKISSQTKKHIDWIKVIQKCGGIYLSLEETSLISYEFDSENASSLIKQGSKIHLFQNGFDVSESSELTYSVYINRNMKETKTVEFATRLGSTGGNWFLKYLQNIILSILIKVKNGKHKAYFDQ